jgi:uncharacterized protein
MEMELSEKFEDLKRSIKRMERVAVAYSGGVDSSLLLKVAASCIPEGDLVALTAVSPSLPASELQDAHEIACQISVNHVLIESNEIEDPNYRGNSSDRCFYCKQVVFGLFREYAEKHGYSYLIDGTNADDVSDHRPGRRAASEHGVRSPLGEVGLTKDEIRQLAKQMGLPNWDKPAAACLASRVPYGTQVDVETLAQIERAEEALKRMGFKQLRVRHHGDIARLELEPEAFDRVLSMREQINAELKSFGYVYIALDLAGFRSGSMNAALEGAHGYRETLPVIQ